MSAGIPPLVQDSGVPFDLFIQALTEQLDKAQAAMALKARVGKLPLTFAVKEVSLDLRAFVQMVDDDVFVRPAGPGDAEASTIKLALTTITKPMIEENAIDFQPEDPKFSLREALGEGKDSEDLQRRLERIGVRNVQQLTELRKTAGTDVIARLARLPVNRLQQALMNAAAPRVTQVESRTEAGLGGPDPVASNRVQITSPLLRAGRLALVRAAGETVPVIEAGDGSLVLAPLAMQLGCEAEIDFGDGDVGHVDLSTGSVGRMRDGRARP
ncbi:hypothetical protein GCM10007860_33600 [Chitiniphilus shinanonensis]|uniref:Uncharacterized protein n=1 Tax=Chitiniphilus shinanonensis TaxID=553088 RepID=A0ABQ6BW35_9NEIS|nr:hypothetical protein [Chitiniphilus shinanonensis]GLS06190.1 hypothetical protein GCM10007860_33600 [Chitiniphilus shinanonensis]